MPRALAPADNKISSKMIKRFLYIAACAVVLAGCVKDDTDFGSLVPADPGTDPVPITPISIEFDTSALTGETETIPTDPTDMTYNDYVENDTFDRTVTVTFNGETATVTGTRTGITATVSGAHVTVNCAIGRMAIVASGTSTNGSLKVYSEHKFKLTLDGLTLTNPTGPAINNQCGKTLYLVLGDGTTNSLADGETYATPELADEQAKGTLFSEGQIIFSGSGALTVNSVGAKAIVSDDYLRFRPGINIQAVSSVDHAIKANDGIWIDGGVINASTSANGAKAIKCDYRTYVCGGRTTLITSGAPVIETIDGLSDTTSCAAIKSDSLMTVSGGTLRLKSIGEGGKGLNTGDDLVITGGTVQVVTTGIKGLSSPKGVKADGDFTISGGSFYSYSAAAAPLEAASQTIAAGYTTLESKPRRLIIEY